MLESNLDLSDSVLDILQADSYMFTCSIGDNTADFCAALLYSVFFIPDKESSN